MESEIEQARKLVEMCEEKAFFPPTDEEREQNTEAKFEKLAAYAVKPLSEYVQYDGFIATEADCVFLPDDDGDCLFKVGTEELMNGNVGVRLLVLPGTKKADAIRVIKKILKWIERQDKPFQSRAEERREEEEVKYEKTN